MVVVLTETGTSARLLAKYRPEMPILAFTAAHDVARQINGYLRNVNTQVSRLLYEVLQGSRDVQCRLSVNNRANLTWDKMVNQGHETLSSDSSFGGNC